MAVVRRRFPPRRGYNNGYLRKRCFQCQRKRFQHETFSRRGLCADCGALNLIAHHFGVGPEMSLKILDPKWGEYSIGYQPDTQTWGKPLSEDEGKVA